MNVTTPSAFFSPDGTHWRNQDAPLDWPRTSDANVTKIVIGTPPRSGEKRQEVTLRAPLPPDLAQRYPNLTHLHLWQVAGLSELPALPAGLQCLDVRGCEALADLPELPESLETLDIGQCVGVRRLPHKAPAALKRFYFNGCPKLSEHYLAIFLECLRNSDARVIEIDGSETPAVKSLQLFPRKSLRKLVLKGCTDLDDVAALGDFHALEHLNLSECPALTELPGLPASLRYLVLHGAENLKLFMGQDIGPYDRGAEDENVARIFLSRAKFGKELAIMPHAKVLFLGDGRVGKSTLAKRLQWEEMSAEDRDNPLNRDLEPKKNEPFTHRVQFGQWKTGICLADKEASDLEQRAAAANVTLPKTPAGYLDGAIRLWDFGGQEIYHSTHRIFAGEGSIFLLVWREHPPDVGQAPPDTTPEEWHEWNRPRPLDYWLDYIDSIRPGAQIALVCTNCSQPDQMKSKPDWRVRAPKYAGRELPDFFVDSLDENCGQHKEYQRLVKWIREACGREAQRIGILQPLFYRQVSDRLDEWLSQNSRDRLRHQTPKHLLCPWGEWRSSVQEAYVGDAQQPRVVLDENDISTITDYLHEAGHLFQIRQGQHRAVLVDQDWAATLIYQILLSGGQLRSRVKGNGGWFYGVDLEHEPHWQSLKDDGQRKRLLAYMEECRIVTRIASAERQAMGQDVFLASDKWLLPTYESVESQVELKMRPLGERMDIAVLEKFEFEKLTLSEFDFRTLLALLARTFGTQALYFRNGFQAHEPGEAPEWCFRVRWLAEEDDPFAGTIDAVLRAKPVHLDAMARRIEDLFYAEGSPIAHKRPPLKRRPADERDLTHEYFRGLRPDEYDVAVSNSGQDRDEATAMVQALRAAGLKVNHYQLPDCRVDDRKGVHNFMKDLGRQPCIVLLLSAGYLKQDPPQENWYCAWELADAIIRLGQGNRTEGLTIAVYKPGDGVNSSTLNELIVPLLRSMGEYFAEAYRQVAWHDQENFKYYDQFSDHFRAAVSGDKCRKFFEARGTLGSYLNLPADLNAPNAFQPIVNAVLKALGKKRAT